MGFHNLIISYSNKKSIKVFLILKIRFFLTFLYNNKYNLIGDIDLEKIKEKAVNTKLYPIYKMFSWDLLFYYSIIYLFLTQVKGLSPADVVLADSCYVIFRVVLLVPLTALIEKLGKRNSIIAANIILAISILTFILSQNFTAIIIANLFEAFGFVIKNISESNLLYDSLPNNSVRGNIFSKIESRGSVLYYFFNAVSALASGFLYVVNGYLPLIICFIMCLISAFIATKFQDVTSLTNSNQIKAKDYVKNLKYAFKNLFKSSRLRNLIFFGGLVSALLSLLMTLRSGLLQELNLPEEYFGIIFGVLEFISGISAGFQFALHKRFRNKTLSIISLPIAVSCIIIGLTVFFKISFTPTIVIILVMFLIQYSCRAPFYNLIKQYLNNFTTSTLRNKISSAYTLIEGISRAFISFATSLLLNLVSVSVSLIFIGCIFTIIFVIFLDHMRKKVGLKPDAYKKKDIEFLELK